MLVDTHCHLHDREFFSVEEAEECLKRAKYSGVEKIICIGTDPKDSFAARDFAIAHDNVFWTFGVHPSEHDKWFKDTKKSFCEEYKRSATGARSAPRVTLEQKDFLVSKPPVAIGEVGLDYHYGTTDKPQQFKLLEEMLQLAKDHNLPVSFHVREAFDDFFGIIANFPNLQGVIHSFSDNKKNLKRILTETDFYIGVNGLATYSTLPTPPLEKILLETDAPFLTPSPYRKEKNEPSHIKDIANWLASKFDLASTEIANITATNAEHLFSLSK